MKAIILFIMISICASGITTAQSNDSLRYKYNNQTIFRSGSVFLKGNERLYFRDLSKEFSNSDLGMAGYEKAKKYKTTSMILRFISLAAGFAVVGVTSIGNNRNLAYGLFGGQIVMSLVSMRYNSLSMQSLDRALWQRNKDVLFPARE